MSAPITIDAYGVWGRSWAEFRGLKFYHDTDIIIDNANTVGLRVYFDRPELFSEDARVSGYISGREVGRIQSIFTKWYSNNMRVICLDQDGDWESQVRIAAKLDLTGWNRDRLAFYSYSLESNSYRKILKPEYFIDINGYLHFKTECAGDIIVSEGELVKR